MSEGYGLKNVSTEQVEGFIADTVRGLELNSALWNNRINPIVAMEVLAAGKIASAKPRPLKRELPAISLWLEYSRAMARYHARLLARIEQSEDWKASKFLLESSAPELYGPDSHDPNQTTNISLKE